MPVKIVFDIGGTNTRVASVVNGKLERILKVPTLPDPGRGLAAFVENIKEVSQGEEVEIIIGGIAGIVNEKGVVRHSPNLEEWEGCDLAPFLKANVCENVTIQNDAALAALGESHYGSGRGHKIVAYLGVGTGVGGARVVDGTIDSTTWGFEPGHQILNWEGKKSLEQLVGGRSLQLKYKKDPHEIEQSVYRELTPVLTTGIYNCILLWSPEVVVIGGSLMNEENGFSIDNITSSLMDMPRIFPSLPEIRNSYLGDEAGLWGACALTQNR